MMCQQPPTTSILVMMEEKENQEALQNRNPQESSQGNDVSVLKASPIKKKRFLSATEKRQQQNKRRPLQRAMSSPPASGMTYKDKEMPVRMRPLSESLSLWGGLSRLPVNRASTDSVLERPSGPGRSKLSLHELTNFSVEAPPDSDLQSPRTMYENDDDDEDQVERASLPDDDLSLKTTLCFRSTRPFDWCRAIPSAIEARAMMTRQLNIPPLHGGKSDTKKPTFSSDMEALETWVSNSLYYVHPAEPLFVELRRVLHDHRRLGHVFVRDPADDHIDDTANFVRRLRQWEEAFVSLFQAFSHGFCRDFYYQAKEFTAHFTRDEGITNDDPNKPDPSLMAVFSSSSRWFRRRLREAGIEFTAPLVTDTDLDKDQPQDETPDVVEELANMSQHALVETAKPRKPRQDHDIPAHRSCIIVRGHMAMRGLFSLLLAPENAFAPMQKADVPTLMSQQPFLYSSLKRLQIFFNSQVHRSMGQSPGSAASAARGGGQDQMESLYQLKIRGHIMPGPLRELCRVVHYLHGNRGGDISSIKEERQDMIGVEEEKDTDDVMMVDNPNNSQAQDWSVAMEVLPGSEAFNLPPPSSSSTCSAMDGDKVATMKAMLMTMMTGKRMMKSKTVEEMRWYADRQTFTAGLYSRQRAERK